MKGSILQAMAEAVEDAAVVVLCISQKYQNSPNCRYRYELELLDPAYYPLVGGQKGAGKCNQRINQFAHQILLTVIKIVFKTSNMLSLNSVFFLF